MAVFVKYQYSNCDLRLLNKIFQVEKFGFASSNLLILMDHLVKTNALFPYNTGLTVVINYFLRDGHIMFSSPIIIILPYHHHRSISLFVGICSKTTANFIIQCYKVLFQQQRTIMYIILDVIKVKKICLNKMSFTSFGEICISFRKSNYFAHVRINMSWIIRCKSNFKDSLYPDFKKIT